MKTKVILITNIVSPYRISLFNYIDQRGDFDFKVVALAEKEKNREWILAKEKIKFDYQVLPGWHLFFMARRREIPIHLNRGVFKILWQYRPDIVITSGYDCLAYWQAFFYCKLFKKKYILWNGTTLLSAAGVKGMRGLLKKIIIRGADKYIAYGVKAKEYLECFGANSQDIYISTNTVDVDFFYREVFQFRKNENFLKERKKYSKVLLLYVGQLVKRKGVIQVLKALLALKCSEISFMIVGSGPEEENLKKFCREYKLDNVFFEGFHQQQILPKYYALADIFILPSFQEAWGLVINEALASGLYILASRYAGATYDLINNENGKIFNPYNIDEIARCLYEIKNRLSQLQDKRERIGDWARENLSIPKSGNAFINAIKAII